MTVRERHFSVEELSGLWGYSKDTIRRLFRNEPGVLKIGSPETRFKRARFQISIPESVAMRVYKERSR
jgi:hypothetical protein